jgi:hypothetical protein
MTRTLLALGLLTLSACNADPTPTAQAASAGDAKPPPQAPLPVTAPVTAPVAAPVATAGSQAPGGAVAPPRPAPPVPAIDTSPVFKTLKPPVVEAAEPYVLKDKVKVPPRPGEHALAFPPADDRKAPARPAVALPPLEVTRHGPDGAQSEIPAVSVTFNQPMVPLASLDDLKGHPVPLTLSPLPKGRFRWLGTSTVTFEADDGRLPYGTAYTAEVPAGTKAEGGRALGKGVRWTFDTPRPVIERFSLDGASEVEPDAALTIGFNQAISPQAVLSALQCKAGSGAAVGFQVATLEGVPSYGGADAAIQKRRYEERNLTLKPTRPMPLGQTITCTLPAGFVGAEGPLATQAAQAHHFHIYDPLKLEKIECPWGQSNCRVEGGIMARFNNTLEPKQELPTHFTVKPEVKGLTVLTSGNTALLYGAFVPETTYTLTVSPGVKDVHKQSLESGGKGDIRFVISEPQLSLPFGAQGVLEGDGPRLVPFSALNLKQVRLRLYPVTAERAPEAFQAAQRWTNASEDPFTAFAAKVDRVLLPGERDGQAHDRGVDVDELLGKGQPGLMIVDLSSRELLRDNEYGNMHRGALVQVTRLGLTVQVSPEKVVALVTSLQKGRPEAGVRVRVMGQSGHFVGEAKTGSNGVAEVVGLKNNELKDAPYWVVADRDGDTALLSLQQMRAGEVVSSLSYGSWNDPRPNVLASLFTDRSPYRPGDTVHLSGVVRVETHGAGGATQLLPPGTKLDWHVTDPRGQAAFKGVSAIGPLGVFTTDLKLPADATLGNFTFQGALVNGPALSNSAVYTNFQVQEFRTPEYRVTLDAGEPLHFVHGKLKGKVVGEFFFGGGMAGAEATWTLLRSAGSYNPPGQTGFVWGEQGAMYGGPMDFYGEYGGRRGGYHPSDRAAMATGTLDGKGIMAIEADLDPGANTGPVSFTLEATVTDKNRQRISQRTTFVAHPSARYVGLKADKTLLKEGESLRVHARVVDLDGKRAAEAPTVELVLHVSERTQGPDGYTYSTRDESAGTCALAVDPQSADHDLACTLVIKKAGELELRASVKDAQGRENHASQRIYAYGKSSTPWYRQDATPQVELVPDKESYAPGETAKVMVKSPFPRSVGLLAVSREGLLTYQTLDFEGPTTVVDVPLAEGLIPGVKLVAALVRGRVTGEEAGAADGDPDDRGRPSFASGTGALALSTASRQVNVTLEPSKLTVDPGESVPVKLVTRRADGTPVSAQVVLAVVDEGVLSLLNYRLPDLLSAMVPGRAGQVGVAGSPPLVIPRQQGLEKAKPRDAAKRAAMPMPSPPPPAPGAPMPSTAVMSERGDTGMEMKQLSRAHAGASAKEESSPDPSASGEGQGAVTPLTARANFASTAFFQADLHTDARGELTLPVTMPDNLTRFRLMAVAVSEGERFGGGEVSVTVRKPLMVRPALPRFLQLGDKFLASTLVTNQTADDLWVDVEARVANGTVDAKQQRVLVRAGESTEVSFDAAAGQPGKSRWQFAAVALTPRRPSDAAELDLPVQMPATIEAFATYGTTEGSVLQPVQLPKDALPNFGGLEVTLSSTALTGLADAVVYLHEYPYECVEQTSSRILPLITMKDVIQSFHLKGAGTAEQRAALVKSGIEKILRKQRNDGGFGYWSDSSESYLYISGWAGYVLARAKQAGFAVDENALYRLKAFLQQRLDSPRHDLGEDTDYDSQAMAALVSGALGQPVPAHVKRIYGQRQHLALDGRAWLLEAAHVQLGATSPEAAELYRMVMSTVIEKASSVHFSTHATESLRLIMHSNDRTDAIVMAALLHTHPADPVLPKAAHGLNEARRHGHWDTTQSNAWATVAFADYFTAFEKTEPHFLAEVFVGDRFAGEQKFQGHTTDSYLEKIPMAAAAGLKSQDLTIGKTGPGRLYYRLGLVYAPKDLKVPALDSGYQVKREYLPMPDAPGTVTTDADGTVHVKAGAEVRVVLTITAPMNGDFVAVDDPLPAGFEAVNTAFATEQSGRLQQAEGNDNRYGGGRGRGWWWGWWSPFQHTEMKDDRVLLFADSLPAGVYTHTYVARATAKGSFQVPPLRALEMYEPENFGRNASTVVEVR